MWCRPPTRWPPVCRGSRPDGPAGLKRRRQGREGLVPPPEPAVFAGPVAGPGAAVLPLMAVAEETTQICEKVERHRPASIGGLVGMIKAEMAVFHSNPAHSGRLCPRCGEPLASKKKPPPGRDGGFRSLAGTCRGRPGLVRGVDLRPDEGSPIPCQPAFFFAGSGDPTGLALTAFGAAGGAGRLGFQLAFWLISQEKSPVSWPDWVPCWVVGL